MYASKFEVGQKVVRRSTMGVYSTVMTIQSIQGNLILCVWTDKYHNTHKMEYLESDLIPAKHDPENPDDDDGGNYDNFLWSDQL